MIIGVNSIYINRYKSLFERKEGKTYITRNLSEVLSKKYKKKVLIINLDFDSSKNIFAEHNIKNTAQSTITDFLECFNYYYRARLTYNFNIDNILDSVLKVNDNLELLTVATNEFSQINRNNVKHLEYTDRISNTHLSKDNNMNFILYMLDIINKSNLWDCVFIDLSNYSNNNTLLSKCDEVLNIISIYTLCSICFSSDSDLINNYKFNIQYNDFDRKNKIVINNIDKKTKNSFELLESIGIEEERLLGYLFEEGLFTSNKNNIEDIIKNLKLI